MMMVMAFALQRRRHFVEADRTVGVLVQLVEPEVVDPVDDSLCAASSALIVAGDICEPPPGMQAELPEAAFPEVEAVPDKSNGLVESWVTPVDCEDDDFDEVSDLRASNTDDAAPRASSMTELL